MKKFVNRIIAGVLAATMLFGTVSCGKKNSETTSANSGEAVASELKNCTFKASDRTFGEYAGDINHIGVVGDNLIVCSNEYYENGSDDNEPDIAASITDADVPVSVLRVYSVPVTGGDPKTLMEVKNTTKSVSGIFDVNGKLGIRIDEYDKLGNNTGSIVVLDADGKEVKNIDVSFAYKEGGYPSDITYHEDEDTVIAYYNDVIRAFDTNGKVKFSLNTNGYLLTAGITKDNLPAAFIYDNEGNEAFLTIDIKNGSFLNTYKTESGLAMSDFSKGMGDFDVVYTNGISAYGYRFSDNKQVKICDYTASDIDTTYYSMSVVLDLENIVILNQNSDTGKYSMESYTKIDPSEYVEKKELTMLCLYAPQDLRSLVIQFNKTHSDVRINIKNYLEEENSYDALSADIAAGNYPDIYYLDAGIGDLSIEHCAAKGMFEDLTPYLEKDPDISASDMIPSIYEASKIEGKTYYLGGYFNIRSIMGRKQEFGDMQGWTFEELKQYVDSKPADCKIFETTNKSEMLRQFLSALMGDFVDWEKGECYFDSTEFKSLLELCNRGDTEATDWDDIDSYLQDVATGKQLLVDGFVTPDEITIYKKVLNGDLTYIGYPNKDRQGVYISISQALAMSPTCTDKDAAWDFIKMIMSKEYQAERYWDPMYGCPTRNDVFDMYLKTFTAKENYTDELGNEIQVRDGTMGIEDIVIDIKPLDQDEIDLFKEQVNRASKVWSYDASLFDIIGEEVGAYFAGDKTLDETASLIQNRAQTYIQENK